MLKVDSVRELFLPVFLSGWAPYKSREAAQCGVLIFRGLSYGPSIGPAFPLRDLKYGPLLCMGLATMLQWVYKDSELGAILYYTVLHYYFISYYIILYSIIFYYIILYSIVLYCIILYHFI